MLDEAFESELILYRFNRLMRELLNGTIKRNTFQPWEIELLLDIDACKLKGPARWQILRQYQRAVQREMEDGATRPMKLSEYLSKRRRKRSRTAAEA